MKLFVSENILKEKLALSDYRQYLELVAQAYKEAPDFEQDAVSHWNALKKSNYTLFKRMLSKVDVVFVTEDQDKDNTFFKNCLGAIARPIPFVWRRNGIAYFFLSIRYTALSQARAARKYPYSKR